MEKYIGESLASGQIQHSPWRSILGRAWLPAWSIPLSPAGAGFFFVGKKDNLLQLCMDYRGLNENRYPIPLISSTFTTLQKAQYFTKLDLRKTYHLVRIREEDEWKTAFNTPRGHYEYCLIPFGLANAPTVFQALVNDILRNTINRHVFSESLEEHITYVRWVLQRLLENRLFTKTEKFP